MLISTCAPNWLVNNTRNDEGKYTAVPNVGQWVCTGARIHGDEITQLKTRVKV